MRDPEGLRSQHSTLSYLTPSGTFSVDSKVKGHLGDLRSLLVDSYTSWDSRASTPSEVEPTEKVWTGFMTEINTPPSFSPFFFKSSNGNG